MADKKTRDCRVCKNTMPVIMFYKTDKTICIECKKRYSKQRYATVVSERVDIDHTKYINALENRVSELEAKLARLDVLEDRMASLEQKLENNGDAADDHTDDDDGDKKVEKMLEIGGKIHVVRDTITRSPFLGTKEVLHKMKQLEHEYRSYRKWHKEEFGTKDPDEAILEKHNALAMKNRMKILKNLLGDDER
jgi:hypothetical protein